MTKNPFLVKAIEDDFHEADVPQKDIAMLEYAKKLTAEPWSIEKADVDALRGAGFKDADILDIAHGQPVTQLGAIFTQPKDCFTSSRGFNWHIMVIPRQNSTKLYLLC